MAESDTGLRTQFVEQCRTDIDEIAETIARCFGGGWSLSVSDPTEWKTDEYAETLAEPGLCLTMVAGDVGFLMLFPASLPLPEWYQNPGDSEAARIATLPLELGESVLPEELRGGQSACITIDDLSSLVAESSPNEDAFAFTFEISGSESPAKVVMVGPVKNPPLKQPVSDQPIVDTPKEQPVPTPAPEPAQQQPTPTPQSAGGNSGNLVQRSRRLMQLEVPVTVRLAEKKIELGQLLKLYPGSLVTFPKSCDDMLDLYVNNQLFARGEAVKIGEKFGLKINEIGAEVERDSGVFTV